VDELVFSQADFIYTMSFGDAVFSLSSLFLFSCSDYHYAFLRRLFLGILVKTFLLGLKAKS
jgi:hypothetical protein